MKILRKNKHRHEKDKTKLQFQTVLEFSIWICIKKGSDEQGCEPGTGTVFIWCLWIQENEANNSKKFN
jgi:hypothetical protein